MRIVIAEDSAMIRAGLVEVLARYGHDVVADVGDAEGLRAAIARHRPDVAVVDVRMPPGYTDEGLRAAIALRRDYPGLGVLVFSQYIETRYAADLLGAASGQAAAGVGYLLKDRVADVSKFVDALSRIAAGGTALDPQVVTQLLGASRRADGLRTLTHPGAAAGEPEAYTVQPGPRPVGLPIPEFRLDAPSLRWLRAVTTET